MLNYNNCDCFEYFNKLEDNSIDLVLSDIPYGISFNATNHMSNDDWDKFSNEEYLKFLDKFFRETWRVAKDNTALIIFVAPTKVPDIISNTYKWNFRPEYYYHYCRAKGRGAKNKLKSLREDILVFSKGAFDIDMFECDDLIKEYRTQKQNPIGYALDYVTGSRVPQYSVLDKSFMITPPTYHSVAEKQIHSCQKPVLLFAELIMMASKEGDTIFDPFMGSGASGIAAYLCDRNYIGVELEKDMFEKAQDWKNKILDPLSRESITLRSYIKKDFKFGRF